MTVAVFAVSTALLAFEILLLRFFAIEHFHHFAYAVISAALLGGGASGTLLVLFRERVRGRERRLFRASVLAFVAALFLAPPLAHGLPFEPTALAWSSRAWLGLGAIQLVLALPFAAGGAAVLLAMLAAPERAPHMYAANLAGSGAGAVVALALLFVPPPWVPRVTPFKGLPQVEAFPAARRLAERWSPLGWVVAVRAPAFHAAPGLSLAFTGSVPPQVAVFSDGELVGAATEWRGDPARAAFLDWLPSAVAYQLGRRPRVLVLGAGPGLEVLSALDHGSPRVLAVELDRRVVGLAQAFVEPASDIYGDPHVSLVIGDARSFAARTRDRFDLVVLSPGEPFGSTAAGVHALAEDHATTVEALGAYLALLAPGGALAVTRWVRTPPRDNVKMILTAAAALRASGDRAPGEHLAFFRSWAAGTLVVRPGGFVANDLAQLRRFAASRLLDADWLAGPAPLGVPAFNRIARPVFREAALAAAAGPDSAARFAARYAFDVRPPTDDRPYFSHFLRLGLLGRLLALGAPSWLPFAEWGYVAVLATLVESAAVAAVLLVVPAAVLARRAPDMPLARLAVYFGAIGLGYLGVEMAFIQKLQLLLGHPVYAVTAALAALLVFSGLGSWWSARLGPARWPPAAAALVIGLEVALAPLAVRGAQPAALPLRAALAVLLIAPPAVLMGMPFPAGVRALVGERPGALAWAWAANGFASVIAASLATLLAIEIGFRFVLACGALCYSIAALAAYLPGVRSPPEEASSGSSSEVRGASKCAREGSERRFECSPATLLLRQSAEDIRDAL